MRLIDELAEQAYNTWRKADYKAEPWWKLTVTQKAAWVAAVESAVLGYLKEARVGQERMNETVGFYRLREDAATIPAQRAGSSVERVVDEPQERELAEPSALSRISIPKPGEG